MLHYRIEIDREEDGRWIAEVIDLPGVLVYGESEAEAVQAASALALEVVAGRLRHGEMMLETPLTLRFEVLSPDAAA